MPACSNCFIHTSYIYIYINIYKYKYIKMQISVIAYTNTEENKKQIILQGAGEEKKMKNLFLAILAFDTLLADTKSEEKNKNKKKFKTVQGENRNHC